MVAMKVIKSDSLLVRSFCLLAAAALIVPHPAFSETLTWARWLPAGCTFLEGDMSKRASFVLRECSRRGERIIKPVSVVFLGKGVVALEMPSFASSYNGLWCSRDAPGLKKSVHLRCGSEGWKPLP